ncbi:hypothetical protein IQ07DRAFT_642132 [Pyrenochaeta sp. DS3sAY3a]|nr:hypothetical protein IQ07DRAFT_642132 [Pyrenochaeta sp. DS3sAY3a]
MSAPCKMSAVVKFSALSKYIAGRGPSPAIAMSKARSDNARQIEACKRRGITPGAYKPPHSPRRSTEGRYDHINPRKIAAAERAQLRKERGIEQVNAQFNLGILSIQLNPLMQEILQPNLYRDNYQDFARLAERFTAMLVDARPALGVASFSKINSWQDSWDWTLFQKVHDMCFQEWSQVSELDETTVTMVHRMTMVANYIGLEFNHLEEKTGPWFQEKWNDHKLCQQLALLSLENGDERMIDTWIAKALEAIQISAAANADAAAANPAPSFIISSPVDVEVTMTDIDESEMPSPLASPSCAALPDEDIDMEVDDAIMVPADAPISAAPASAADITMMEVDDVMMDPPTLSLPAGPYSVTTSGTAFAPGVLNAAAILNGLGGGYTMTLGPSTAQQRVLQSSSTSSSAAPHAASSSSATPAGPSSSPASVGLSPYQGKDAEIRKGTGKFRANGIATMSELLAILQDPEYLAAFKREISALKAKLDVSASLGLSDTNFLSRACMYLTNVGDKDWFSGSLADMQARAFSNALRDLHKSINNAELTNWNKNQIRGFTTTLENAIACINGD